MESKDYAISMTIMDASNSQRVQNDQIEQMINDGCNVLCVNLADRTEPSEIIDAAKEKDIPIIFFNREPVEEDMRRWDKLYYVGGKAKQSGELQENLQQTLLKSIRRQTAIMTGRSNMLFWKEKWVTRMQLSVPKA